MIGQIYLVEVLRGLGLGLAYRLLEVEVLDQGQSDQCLCSGYGLEGEGVLLILHGAPLPAFQHSV